MNINYNTDTLFKELRPAFHARRFVVALSGGLDSMVLLHSLNALPLSQKVIALHINHQLNEKSTEWEQHCREVCEQLGVEFFSRTANVVVNGSGLEDAARSARYREFAEFLEPGDCLLSAHHLNDQAETFLLRLMRGSGPRGLSGMPLARQVGEAYVYRPLLGFPRRDLMDYAEHNGLRWIEDDSNANEDFDRNFIRKQIINPLKKRWPAMLNNVTRSANLSREAEELSRELASIDLFACYPRDERWGYSIALAYLKGCTRVRQKNAVRFWIAEKGLELPGRARLEEIVDNVIHASDEATPLVSWDGIECRRFAGRLFLTNALASFDPTTEVELTTGDFVNIPGVGEVSFSSDIGCGLHIDKDDKILIRFRHGGERCKPEGRRHSQKLKKLMQECEVPHWVRDRTPLIYVNNKLAAVGDFWINEGFGITDEKETGFVVGCYYDLGYEE